MKAHLKKDLYLYSIELKKASVIISWGFNNTYTQQHKTIYKTSEKQEKLLTIK